MMEGEGEGLKLRMQMQGPGCIGSLKKGRISNADRKVLLAYDTQSRLFRTKKKGTRPGQKKRHDEDRQRADVHYC